MSGIGARAEAAVGGSKLFGLDLWAKLAFGGLAVEFRCFGKASHVGHEPAYREASLVTEGRIVPGTEVVRVFSSKLGNMERSRTLLGTDIEGFTSVEVQQRWAIPYSVDMICNVEATGLRVC